MSVNLLLSYAFHERTDLAKVRRNLVCGRLLIDSGAFTAFTTGKTITLDSYAGFLEKWRGCWDHAITLDVIGDPAKTAAQTRKLHERGLPVMPVFTRGGNLAEFDAMVRDAGYVAVGGTVGLGTKPQRERVAMLQRRAQDLGGGIHALGVGSLSTLRVARPYSADASSISGAFRFGTVVYFDGREVRNTPISNRAKLTRDRDHLRAHGVDLAPLVRSGRMPGQMTGRKELMQAMSLAYAAADETLKRTGLVPAPRHGSSAASQGTHLYSSVADRSGAYAYQVSEVDAQIHDGPHLYASINRGGGPRGAEAEGTSALDTQLHGPHLYHACVGKNDNAERVAEMDTALHAAGPHIYSSLSGSGGGVYPELRALEVAEVDTALHDGPHIYSSVTGSPTNGHGLQRALEVAELDAQLHDGPHLYSSVGGGWLADASMKVDGQVHTTEPPHVWRIHGRDHHRWCRATPTTGA